MEVRTDSRDWAVANAYRMRHYRGAKATVPGGHEIAIDANEYIDVQPPGSEYDGVVDKIHDFLKHPKVGAAYVWRRRPGTGSTSSQISAADMTSRLVELHYIRPVSFSELKDTAVTANLFGYVEAGVVDAEGGRTTQTCVGWQKDGLYEVRPDIAQKWFLDPGRYHMRLIAEIPEQVNNDFEEAGVGTAKMERKDPATQAQEVLRDQRRGK